MSPDGKAVCLSGRLVCLARPFIRGGLFMYALPSHLACKIVVISILLEYILDVSESTGVTYETVMHSTHQSLAVLSHTSVLMCLQTEGCKRKMPPQSVPPLSSPLPTFVGSLWFLSQRQKSDRSLMRF